METLAPLQQGERRCAPDRRTRPTSVWNAIGLRGRRRGFRRASEGHHAYMDCPSRHVVFLVLFVVVASVLDAVFTLCHLQNGAREANPLMAFVLAHGPKSFVYLKMALTCLGAWGLAVHQNFPLAYWALQSFAGVYAVLLVAHVLFFFDHL